MSPHPTDRDCLCPPRFSSGLDAFGRPIPGIFAEHRVTVFEAMSRRSSFAHWQSGQGSDIGMMVLDWVAYLWDNLSFYNDAWMREQHLLTARQDASLRQLAKLTGYAPRPNLAATARLVAVADAKAPFVIGPALGITSEGGDTHGALPFETVGEAAIDPARSKLTAIMPRGTVFDPAFIAVGNGLRNLRVDEPVVFVAADGTAKATMLREIRNDKFPSGETYAELILDDGLDDFAGIAVADLSVFGFASDQTATRSDSDGIAVASATPSRLSAGNMFLQIAGVQPQYHAGQQIVVANDDTGSVTLSQVARVHVVNKELVGGERPVFATYTWLEIATPLPAADQYRVFARPLRGARLIGAPLAQAGLADFGGRIALVEKYLGDSPEHMGPFVVVDAQDKAVGVTARLEVHPHNQQASLVLSEVEDASTLLKAPVTVYGNFIDVDQGKTVIETLGNTTGRRFQHFRLAQKPLTWLRRSDTDPTPAIELFVNNVPWTYAAHLLGVTDDARVYTLKVEADGQATIILGGAPKAGQKNVVARYRHGTTGENPAPRTINTPAGRIAGVAKVFNPFSALGGLAGDTAEDLRDVLPARIIANDRCVSAQDYNVNARNFGALAADTRVHWTRARKQWAVETTVIFDGGLDAPLAASLRAYLTARAPEASLVDVREAIPQDGTIDLTVRIAPDAVAEDVRRAIDRHYFDPYRGQLALRRIRIGHGYSRADLLRPLDAIPGVLRIERLALDGSETAPAFAIASGHYLRATLNIEVLR
ncbi:hypothetical protein [Yoonia vestfoldensis]|uniref:hypothetical protein n=1 Tax=Yoonia vestfoldensis TaxID=245188 RepID=UPI00037747E3|nr:hypothetical protein [Yoonia vestfoldensis]